ncbi:hypothetical protein HDU93_009156 [Gonapodya sp. JEL0774]|nr:hypothetical protein HDU93_009156 [Gonapodya sp. JEL0774]
MGRMGPIDTNPPYLPHPPPPSPSFPPQKCVDQSSLEQFDGVSTGKYTVGLGQHRMAFVDDREDINSVCLTAVHRLLTTYSIPPTSIGRLEVGTETLVDKSKSVKTVLMSLFAPHNTEIEGVDTTNACYGGTNALFNAVNWVQSDGWDGRDAIVVAGDIAVYASGAARPTGGAGCVAMLVGAEADLVVDTGGYNRNGGLPPKSATVDTFDYFCFHSPYGKLVQKSFARLAFNDLLRSDRPDKWNKLGDVERFKTMKVDDTYFDKDLEKTFVAATKEAFLAKVDPTLLASREMGNMYTGSLYGGLATLISEVEPDKLVGKRVVLFSYGSGLASSMFSLRFASAPTAMHTALQVRARLASRTVVPPADFDATMKLREHSHNLKAYVPQGGLDGLFPGTYYIQQVDDKFRRAYGRTKAEDAAESSATLVEGGSGGKGEVTLA